MKNEKSRFRLIDGLLIAMMVVPLVIAMVIQILTEPASEGITITGAKVFLTIPMPLMDMLITEAQVNSWLVMISIVGLCLFLTQKVAKITTSQMIRSIMPFVIMMIVCLLIITYFPPLVTWLPRLFNLC